MAEWVWLPDLGRYRDLNSGRFVSSDQVRAWAQESIAASGNAAREAAGMLANGSLNTGDWEQVIRQELKDEYIRQYVLSKGGVEQMTSQDWGSVGGMLSDQYRYLDAFADQVAEGNLTEGQIAARAEMYFNSANEAWERANARAQGAPDLPAYPGDGSTECRTNCHCTWDLVQTEDGDWEATWVIDPAAESCPTCIERAQTWNPLILRAE